MPSSRARSSTDTALIDRAPTPKPRAARKTATPPVEAGAVAPAVVPLAKKAVRKTAASKKTSEPPQGAIEPVAEKATAEKAAAPKVAAKKAPAKKPAAAKTSASSVETAEAVAVPAEPPPIAAKPRRASKTSSAPAAPVVEGVAPRPARKRGAKPAVTPEPAEPVQALLPIEAELSVPGIDVTPAVADEAVIELVVEPSIESAIPAFESLPEPEPELPLWSSVQLQADAWGQHLQWQVGQGCPTGLAQQAQALMDGDGALDPRNDQGLLALHQAAIDAGHDLRIDLSVWSAVAAGRDLRWRVHLLEQAYPEGAASAALQALWPATAGRLTAFQWEGALFAACAGRSVLADDLSLAPAPQALAAAVLLTRHFGVRRVLIVCSDAHVLSWQRLLAALPALPHRLCGESAWRAEVAELTAWAPELVIVDDSAAWQAGEAPAWLRALPAGYAMVLMPEPTQRPQALSDWLSWLDPMQVGVARAFLRRHRGGAADGGAEWVGLDRLRDTLAPVMLRRTRSRWMQPVPGRRDRLVWVPLDAPAQAAQEAALVPLRAVVGRWREVGYVSDQDQLTLREGLAALRQVCAAQSSAKREAMAGLTLNGAPAEGVCAELPWPLSTLRAPRDASATPTTYLLMEGGLDEQRLWLRCIEPQADDWLCDPVLFHQGPALVRRMEAVAGLVDRWAPVRSEVVLRDVHHYSA